MLPLREAERPSSSSASSCGSDDRRGDRASGGARSWCFLAGRAAEGGLRVALTVLAIASVVLGWAVVHTVYALRYARLYYAPPPGGLGFAEHEPPVYADFAYVAVTIGMTYQVSDTDISKRGIRRAAIHHALLSYLFGAVILGVVVSTVASLLGS